MAIVTPNNQHSQGKIQISIFDLDNTLVRGNLSIRFGYFLFQKGLLGYSKLVCIAFFYGLHKLSLLPNQMMQEAIFSLAIKEQSKKYICSLAEEFLNAYLDQLLCPIVRARLVLASEQNHQTWILSSSPDFLVELVARRLNVANWDATKYFVDKTHRFSAIGPVLDGIEKANKLKQLETLCKCHRENITVYSDSILDLPLLLRAGSPVVVRPCRRLRKICGQKKWELIE